MASDRFVSLSGALPPNGFSCVRKKGLRYPFERVSVPVPEASQVVLAHRPPVLRFAALFARDGQPSLSRLHQIVIDELHYLGLSHVRRLCLSRTLDDLVTLCFGLSTVLNVKSLDFPPLLSILALLNALLKLYELVPCRLLLSIIVVV